MALLLGLLFCLANLSKHNELIAMRASGVSLLRLALPLLGIGIAATLVVLPSMNCSCRVPRRMQTPCGTR